MQVVGLDGWRGGWVAVVLEEGRFLEAAIAATVGQAASAYPAAAVLGIDIPIGLPESGRRRADEEARRRLGPRRSSVFFTPPRSVIETDSYAAANALAKAEFGFGISKQAYMLRPKILEVDRHVRSAAGVIREVHPELAFRDLAGADVPSKQTYAGIVIRRRLLEGAGVVIPEDIGEAGSVPLADVLDAAAVATVADKIGRNVAVPIPDPPVLDGQGIPMAIWH